MSCCINPGMNNPPNVNPFQQLNHSQRGLVGMPSFGLGVLPVFGAIPNFVPGPMPDLSQILNFGHGPMTGFGLGPVPVFNLGSVQGFGPRQIPLLDLGSITAFNPGFGQIPTSMFGPRPIPVLGSDRMPFYGQTLPRRRFMNGNVPETSGAVIRNNSSPVSMATSGRVASSGVAPQQKQAHADQGS